MVADAYEKYLASNPMKCCVCGIPFNVEKPAITKEFTGEYYAFCSQDCMRDFEQNPERFAQFSDDEDDA